MTRVLPLLLVAGCYAVPEPPADPDYVGTWPVVSYRAGPCDARELADFGGTHVQIELLRQTGGQDVVLVYPCEDETQCETAFSAYTLEPVDAMSAMGTESGASVLEGSCDLFWVTATLELADGRITIDEVSEGNDEPVPGSAVATCEGELEEYAGARTCIRHTTLVLDAAR